MSKPYKAIKTFTLFACLTLFSLFSSGQQFADTSFYLIDSLDLKTLPEADQELLKTSLTSYHKAKTDTSKLQALNPICEGLTDNVWIKYQFVQFKLTEKALKKPNISKDTYRCLNQLLAGAVSNIGFNYENFGEVNKALQQYEKSLAISKEINDYLGMARAYNNMGYIYEQQGDVSKSLDLFKKSLLLKKAGNDLQGMANTLHNIGYIYEHKGDIFAALDYYHKSLKIREQLNDNKGMAYAFNNLGIVYEHQGDTVLALRYYRKGMAILSKLNDKYGYAHALNNIGHIHQQAKNYDSAHFCFKSSLDICLQSGDKHGEANALNNLGIIYRALKQPEQARIYFTQALSIHQQIENKPGIAESMNNLANILYDLDYNSEKDKVQFLARQSFLISEELGFPESIRNAAFTLSKISALENEWEEAYTKYKLYIEMRDSLHNQETEKAAAKQQIAYQYEKDQAVKDAEHKKNLEIMAEKKNKQAIISYSIAAALALVLGFLAFVFNRLKLTKKQKSIIENQKTEVENQKARIEETHAQLEEKNKEVMDSIRYAERIQRALLKSEKHESKHLPEHFILFKPKDIVSGDFYWALEKENNLYLAAADCTGHGVPGAFLTMLGTSFLNEINATDKILSPATILNQLRDRFIKELNQSSNHQQDQIVLRDGMDISLLKLEVDSGKIEWSGANNPLYIIRKEELLEFKADKQPIGFSYQMTPFTNHECQLEKEDFLYIFTDGYADQFGGPRGKKYKYSTLKSKLVEICKHPVELQKQLLTEEFTNWKSDLEQVDDICIIGLRV